MVVNIALIWWPCFSVGSFCKCHPQASGKNAASGSRLCVCTGQCPQKERKIISASSLGRQPHIIIKPPEASRALCACHSSVMHVFISEPDQRGDGRAPDHSYLGKTTQRVLTLLPWVDHCVWGGRWTKLRFHYQEKKRKEEEVEEEGEVEWLLEKQANVVWQRMCSL